MTNSPLHFIPKRGQRGGGAQFQFGFIGRGGGGVVFESIKPFSKRHHLLPPRSFSLSSLLRSCMRASICRSELANFSRGALELKEVEASDWLFAARKVGWKG